MDPNGCNVPDTTDADPHPVLRLMPGLYQCASFTRRGTGYLVDSRGPRPVCAHPHWQPGTRCKHIAEVERQAAAIEAGLLLEQGPEIVKTPTERQALGKAAYRDLWGD